MVSSALIGQTQGMTRNMRGIAVFDVHGCRRVDQKFTAFIYDLAQVPVHAIPFKH